MNQPSARLAAPNSSVDASPHDHVCPRCGAHLRGMRDADPAGLCDPCREVVDSCTPYIIPAAPPLAGLTAPAPDGVNLLELAGGLLLLHDALHPGETLHLRETLALYGVDTDRVTVRGLVGKLRRRHGIVAEGVPRQPGYAVRDWTWEARRLRSSLADG